MRSFAESSSTPELIRLKATETPAATVEVEAPTGFSGHGWYWNPAEGGTGFFFEAQAKTGFAAFFLYDESGAAVWYAASGTMTPISHGYSFTGSLYRYSGGQPANSSVGRTPRAEDIGPVSIAFSGDGASTAATVSFPGGRQMLTQRFSFGTTAGASTHATLGFPETGWYWDPTGGGRGWAIEVQGGEVFMVMYHYNSDGSPTWNTVQGPLGTSSLTRSFNKFRGGQTLAGAYRAPTSIPPETNYTLTNSGLCLVLVTYPGLAPQTLRRFKFGRIDSAGACRSLYNTSLSNPEAGSTAATGNGLEGYWVSGDSKESWGMIRPDGSYYFTGTSGLGGTAVSGGFTASTGIKVPLTTVSTDTRYWVNGTIALTSSSAWATTAARHLELPYAASSSLTNRSGSGIWASGRTFRGTIGNAPIVASYSEGNARALELSSLQGQWGRPGITITISFDGVIQGVQSYGTQGKCGISGRIQPVTLGAMKNLFEVDLTYYNQSTTSYGFPECTLTGTAGMLGSVHRVQRSSTDPVLIDRLNLQGWSSTYTQATYFDRL